MRSSEIITLLAADREYNHNNEQVTRRTIEQFYAMLRDDIRSSTDQSDSVASLALRRHQFLLMGG